MAKAPMDRPGLPQASSVLATKQLAPGGPAAAPGAPGVAGAHTVYKILRTDEVDAKDAPISPALRSEMMATGAAAPTRAAGDNFGGTARRKAKLSISSARLEKFVDVKALIATLPSLNDMKHHDPAITVGVTSARVEEEERNVSVDAFIYAASRENDNDFHVILGRAPDKRPPVYMTMEISALPSRSSASFRKLKVARDAYKTFFGADLQGATYDYYDPPIPIRVEGSLFFDMSHASGASPGPKSLHDDMPVIWEIHPVSKIVFEP